MLGILSYHIYHYLGKIKLNSTYLKIVFSVILCFIIFYEFIPVSYKIFIYFPIFFLSVAFIFHLTKKWKIDSYIGELSYPMYISHLFVLSFINFLKIPEIGGLGLTLAVLTIVFSVFLNELVAKRIEKFRQGRVLNTSNKNL